MELRLRKHLFIFLTVILVLITIHRLQDFSGIRYATSDNIDYAVGWFERNKAETIFELGVTMALEQGRVGHLITATTDAFFSMLKSQTLYDLFNLGSVVLSFALVGLVLARLTSVWLALIFWVLAVANFPQLWHYTPPAAFPVWPWLPFIGFPIAILMFLRHVERGGQLSAVVALLAYAISFFFYESFLLILPSLALLILYLKAWPPQVTAGQRNRYAAWILFVPAAYAALYVGFRMLSGPAYDGVQVADFSFVEILGNIFRVFYQYSIGGFSIYYVLHGRYTILYNDVLRDSKISMIPTLSLQDVLTTTPLMDWVVALATAGAVGVAIWQLRGRISPRGAGAVMACGLFIAFSSLVLYGLTAKYPEAVRNPFSSFYFSYVGARHAYIGWTVFFVGGLAFLGRISRRKTAAQYGLFVLVAFVTFYVSLASSYFNDYVADSLRVQTATWRVVDTAMSCSPLMKDRGHRRIYAPRMKNFVWWGRVRESGYWDRYAELRGLTSGPAFVDLDEKPGDIDLFLDYSVSADGKIVGIFLAERWDNGRADKISILSPRDRLLLLLFDDARGRSVESVFWNSDSESCGDNMVNSISGRNIELKSLQLLSPPLIPIGNRPPSFN